MENQLTQDTRRLPLWRDLLDRMIQDGLTINKSYPLSFFVDGMSAPENSAALAFGIYEIRKALRRAPHGFVLTSRGRNGQEFVLLHPRENFREMNRLQNVALSALREGVILGTSTPIDTLTNDERRRHEGVLEKIAMRSALMGRGNRQIPNSPVKIQAP